MKRSFAKTTTIITVLSIFERGLGFLYRIVLSRLIGAEGLGLYQVSLSLFSLFLTLGTGGIPITVSRMVIKAKAQNSIEDERSAVTAGVSLSLLFTLPACLLFFLFGNHLSFLFSDERCMRIFRILLLGLVFSSLYAVFRGYFWGNKNLLLPSILEIAEESVMVVVGILLLKNVSSPDLGAEKAAWAVVISYLFSFSASSFAFFLYNGKFSSSKKHLKPLFHATLPITSVRASGSLVNSAIAVLLPVMLIRAGFSEQKSLELFGVVSGMVMPILFIPSTIIGSFALVLVPELSEDFYRKNYTRLRKNIASGMLLSLLVSCAIIPFFYALGEDIGRLAYANATAGIMISKSSFLLLPMSLTMISTSILNSLGFEKQTFVFYFIGAAALLLCVLFLPTVCGVYAYLLGLGASFTLNALCNLVFLYQKSSKLKKQGGQVRVERIIFLFTALFFTCFAGKFFTTFYKNYFGEWLAIFASGFTILFLWGVLGFLFQLLHKKTSSGKKRHAMVYDLFMK